ncbi:hypothetical protein BT96DRAFT_1017683 [Gymnopus androsaceus JB14]|uniref:Uncharacterized protein n=1 Tax=Gymnopus androsaceus JB14 TaxID=1447944 RepID=A0A6A4HWG9_9AGAR|nr:hypothetical protein BT96DRAFT_1017683 [Gymnopus androsaceus JB14]
MHPNAWLFTPLQAFTLKRKIPEPCRIIPSPDRQPNILMLAKISYNTYNQSGIIDAYHESGLAWIAINDSETVTKLGRFEEAMLSPLTGETSGSEPNYNGAWPFQAKLWGLDLNEMRWDAFKGKNMYSRAHHLRRERLIAYQIATNIGAVAQGLATFSMHRYNSLQTHIQQYALTLTPAFVVGLHNDDIIAAEILTLTFGALASVLFNIDLLLVVQWPRHIYPRWYNYTRMALAIVFTAGLLAAAILSTVVVTTHSAFITGAPVAMQEQYTDFFSSPPLKYKDWAINIAYVSLLWVSCLFTIASAVIMLISVGHEMKYEETNDISFVINDENTIDGSQDKSTTLMVESL